MARTGSIILDSTPIEKPPRRVVAIIPARLASTRLPRKVLRELAGKPLLEWVYQAANRCPGIDQVVIATDSEEVADLCRARAWTFLPTSPHLPSGSDRVDAVSRHLEAQGQPADIYVNIQSDEPLLQPGHIAALLRPFEDPAVQVSTLRVLCNPENIANPNAVKVVTALHGRALYFSRATIPFHRDVDLPAPVYWKHIGLYAYRPAALHRFTALAPSALELCECLEQLRFLENNIPVQVETVLEDTIGVDTEQDLHQVEAILRSRHPTT